jgi:hypothetical protein
MYSPKESYSERNLKIQVALWHGVEINRRFGNCMIPPDPDNSKRREL